MLKFTKPARTPDFKDCFSGSNAYQDKSAKELAEIAIASSPFWFRTLFSLRQRLASMAGLRIKTPGGENPGVGFLLSLPILQEDENVYEAGLKDKHLDFTLKVEKEGQRVHLTTEIWFNHISGKLYLFIVKPFHNKIVSHWVKELGNPV